MVGRGVVGPFDGDLDDYQRYLLEESKRLREEARQAEQAQTSRPSADTVATAVAIATAAAAPAPAPVVASAAPAATPTPATRDGREQRKVDAQARLQLAEKTRPLKKELEQIDKRMGTLTTERAALEQKLTEPLPATEIVECGKRLKAFADETARLEERWLEISAELEEMSTALAD